LEKNLEDLSTQNIKISKKFDFSTFIIQKEKIIINQNEENAIKIRYLNKIENRK
jgi:hypothetical protein